MLRGVAAIIARQGVGSRFGAPSALVSSTKIFRIGGTTGGSNITYSTLTFCEGRFTGGNIVLLNGLSSSCTIDGVMVAPTAAENDGYNPVDSLGAAQTWTTLSGGPWTIPAATVPGTGSAVPGILSIPFTLSSIDRTDIVGAPCLLMVRVHASTPISPAAPSTTEMSGFSTITSGARKQKGFFKSQSLSNFNIPANFTSPTQQYVSAIGIEFAVAGNAKTILVLGDSTHQGAGSTSGYWPGVARAAAALSTLSEPISVVNCAVQGQDTDTTQTVAETYIQEFLPQAVCIPFWSVNNVPTTQAAADATLTWALRLAAKCERSGIKPFLIAPNPAAISLANDVIRKQTITNAKASAYTVIDMGAAVTDGASPERIQAAYTIDSTHCNDTGYEQQDLLAFRPALQEWIGL